jgi:hypothetical protein
MIVHIKTRVDSRLQDLRSRSVAAMDALGVIDTIAAGLAICTSSLAQDLLIPCLG